MTGATRGRVRGEPCAPPNDVAAHRKTAKLCEALFELDKAMIYLGLNMRYKPLPQDQHGKMLGAYTSRSQQQLDVVLPVPTAARGGGAATAEVVTIHLKYYLDVTRIA
jgi:hypothetical protein